MKKLIQPTTYNGNLSASPSKSFMQRAIAIALLADGQTTLSNPCFSNDSQSALKMAENLGATIQILNDKVIIEGTKGELKNDTLSAGESGLGIRCFVPLAALFSNKITLEGKGSLNNRPISMLVEPLKELGVQITTNNGFLPIHVKGPITGGKIKVDGSISSQVLTGLLIALSKAKKDSEIEVYNLQSIPYIDMTLQIMKGFGVQVEHDNYHTFYTKGNQSYKGRKYTVEGDWSGMAFHLVGGAISGSVEINNLNINSTQADKAILKALKSTGAEISTSTNSITVKQGQLQAFTFDATHCPDLFPPLSNLAAACHGTSIIKGISRLIHKESNRALSLQQEWKKLGIKIDLIDNEMHITGGEITGGEIDSHNDHRIAMMGAIAALISTKPIEITNSQAVNKSYPSFFEDFNKLGTKNNEQ
jgi:3-phosphoshikimate 1-carboxyvinyltransferase